jgi:hypothetical protein
LDKKSLANSITKEILDSEVHPLPPKVKFDGAGIYCLYYCGDFASPVYQMISDANRDSWKYPIYIGKAVPEGSRKGTVGLSEAPPGPRLYMRLREHSKSISNTATLSLEHFRCRFLVTDEIWIALGESVLLRKFKPLWNSKMTGFGNHTPGVGRPKQAHSKWDLLHPGRSWTLDPRERQHDLEVLMKELEGYQLEPLDDL